MVLCPLIWLPYRQLDYDKDWNHFWNFLQRYNHDWKMWILPTWIHFLWYKIGNRHAWINLMGRRESELGQNWDNREGKTKHVLVLKWVLHFKQSIRRNVCNSWFIIAPLPHSKKGPGVLFQVPKFPNIHKILGMNEYAKSFKEENRIQRTNKYKPIIWKF